MTETTTTGGLPEVQDAGGIARRGESAEYVRGCVERFGEPPRCFVGVSRPEEVCERPAVMEVYSIAMCEIHGEEAASGALEEIAHDLEQELQRPMNCHVRALSPHIERALRHGFESLSEQGNAYERDAALLLAAFPLDRDRACKATLEYARNPDANGRETHEPPYDAYLRNRMLLHRHMRLAFEEGADWLVEMLEGEREQVAAQAAYALALEKEAGLR